MVETELPDKATLKMKVMWHLWNWYECYCYVVFEWDGVFWQASIAWLEGMLYESPRLSKWSLDEFWQAIVSDNR